ncbi:MAG TPA: HAD-IB family phosphatase [Candidatus Chromulinivoraceae bacterium]|nr:HAD-IB family phosphatase [Candidatus Chromulinivoraceae bacterium]
MDLTYIFDFDNTLVSVESLDELARMSLERADDKETRLAEFVEITNQGMNGTLAFDESLRRRLATLNVTRDDVHKLTELLKDTITDSALECEEWFDENADNIYVVSGGFEDYIIPVVEELGIPAGHVYANRFVYDDTGMVIGFDTSSNLSKPQGKVLQVAELELPSPIIMVGDGMTDYEVRSKGEADEFWAFTQHVARPVVVERADRVLASFEEIEEIAELIS